MEMIQQQIAQEEEEQGKQEEEEGDKQGNTFSDLANEKRRVISRAIVLSIWPMRRRVISKTVGRAMRGRAMRRRAMRGGAMRGGAMLSPSWAVHRPLPAKL